MNPLFNLFVISFLLQSIGLFCVRKGIKNMNEKNNLGQIKVGMNAILWGILMQLLIILTLLYSKFVMW